MACEGEFGVGEESAHPAEVGFDRGVADKQAFGGFVDIEAVRFVDETTGETHETFLR